MIDISNEAYQKMKELLAQKETGDAIRIAPMGSMGLGIIVDSAKGTDTTFDKDGLPVVIDTKLMEFCKTISISFADGEDGNCHGASYIIRPENPL